MTYMGNVDLPDHEASGCRNGLRSDVAVGVASCTWVRVYRRTMTNDEQVWVPRACTLPTADRPLRLAEFDDLFATAVRGVEALHPTHARLRLAGPAGLEARLRDLTARENECCCFIAFTITAQPAIDGEAMVLDVEVPSAHADVLECFVQRASTISAGQGT